MQQFYKKIYDDPKFHELEGKRGKFSWCLALAVLVIYYAFILIIAFRPEIFAIPLSDNSVITWGIPVGVFVIIISFLLTGIYVWRANNEFDQIGQDLIEHHVKKSGTE
ncbi:MAG: DUF485 domain-containing protein [Gammaproteobacteria bacterium]|nr:MAG: DUF485 domain-containing protein [Gammaproteobacteria bacterium]RKZ71086.1 MAG: DUF485 domain-containing protein [Gammaproteobacteria bacterium]